MDNPSTPPVQATLEEAPPLQQDRRRTDPFLGNAKNLTAVFAAAAQAEAEASAEGQEPGGPGGPGT